jgi:O-antigen/teichoic acid export membrane protein
LNPLKQLAGQTAVYGLSSILGRLLSYLLVPLYTRVFVPAEYGINNEMYAYVSLLIVILTYGFETGFFRFNQTHDNKDVVYSTTLISLLVTSSLFAALIICFAQPVANIIQHPANSEYIVWLGLIISLDAFSSIPFARLRVQNKARRFATIKLIGIFTYIAFNLFFILLCPYLLKHSIGVGFLDVIYNKNIGIGYIFISNLISSLITILLLLPEIVGVKYKFDYKLWKTIFRYSFPLLIVGLAGIINETMDRLFLTYLLPKGIAMSEVGIYGACYKISIFLTLFVQAFRFAAEPFFFAQANEQNAKKIYSDTMTYFTLVCSFIFLGVMLYIDIAKYFIGSKYYEGLPVVPILLIANICLGIYYNLSIWYKLTGQTKFGAFISVAGAVLTIILNIWLIPIIGYMGSAWTTLICYAFMMVASYFFGQKYYHINYNLSKILLYFGLSLLLYFISVYLNIETKTLKILVHSMLMISFLVTVFLIERKNIRNLL